MYRPNLAFLAHSDRNFSAQGSQAHGSAGSHTSSYNNNYPSSSSSSSSSSLASHQVGGAGGGSDGAPVGKSCLERMADVVEYLQNEKRNQSATHTEVSAATQVHLLGRDAAVLAMLRTNAKVIVEEIFDYSTSTGAAVGGKGALIGLRLQYRTKYDIKDRMDLLNQISRLRWGVCRSDIRGCYPSIETDIDELIFSGEIIAIPNKEAKDVVMFPRGRPFISKLSGDVTITLNSDVAVTSTDLRHEIRRGDAIEVGGVWYRVSGLLVNNRNRAPPSVSSTHDINTTHEFALKYTETSLPLSNPVAELPPASSIVKSENGSSTSTSSATNTATVASYKHGCSNDIRDRWVKSVDDIRIKEIVKDDRRLEDELLKLGLIKKDGVFSGLASGNQKRRLDDDNANKQKRPRKVNSNKFNRITNVHLIGSTIGKILKETTNAGNS